MITLLKQCFRRFFPRQRHPLLDRPTETNSTDIVNALAYASVTSTSGLADAFIVARYTEGQRWRGVLCDFMRYTDGRRQRVLDVGGGNGAIELALAAGGFLPVSVEPLWNQDARRIHCAAGVPLRRVLADAARLPFRSATFDAVICLETIEHLREPKEVGAEIGRVLQACAPLLLTTPPRLRYLLQPDPHFGIRFLLAVPSALQRRIAAARGFRDEQHFVNRIYVSIRGIRRLFPGFAVAAVLSRSRAPRHLFWDAVVLKKSEPSSH